MAEALLPEEQISALRREATEREAMILALSTGLAAEQAANKAQRAETATIKARLTTVLLEIEHLKMQLASLRRERSPETFNLPIQNCSLRA